jgi:excisionase family DNA binding protein
MNINTNKLVSIRNAAKELGISRMTLYRWISDKKIQAVSIDGRFYFERRVLTNAIENPFAKTKMNKREVKK